MLIQKNKHSPNINEVKLETLKSVVDDRGNLIVGEFNKEIPFTVKRFFLITDSPTSSIRGEHAHIKCHQFLICMSGMCEIIIKDGSDIQKKIILDKPNIGLYIPNLVWASQHYALQNTQLLVFASEYYDPMDYLRNYEEYRNYLTTKKI